MGMRRKDPVLGRSLRMSAIGIELSILVVGGLLVGWKLDHYWGTDPYVTLGGLTFGCVAGFWSLFRTVHLNQDSEETGL